MRRFAPRDFEMLPESYYNLKPRLKRLPRPPLHPATGEPLSPSDLEPLFPRGFITHEGSMEREVEIPMPTSSSPADNVHPLNLLERVAGLSRRFAAASYVTWQSSRGLIQTRLQLRLAESVQVGGSGQARLMAE